jgi:glycosyltransferase involved in cell wall biosynthesis
LASPDFIRSLIAQQQPQVLLSNLPYAALCKVGDHLSSNDAKWIHRVSPEETDVDIAAQAQVLLLGRKELCDGAQRRYAPYIDGLDPRLQGTADATEALQRIEDAVLTAAAADSSFPSVEQRHFVMRQQLFGNSSLSQVMFELSNALIELGVPTIPQDEVPIFAGGFVHREEQLFRSSSAAKFNRIQRYVARPHNPELSITLHFALIRAAAQFAHSGAFPSLAGEEVLYATGRYAVTRQMVELLTERFTKVLAPSRYVLDRYFQAGLSGRMGAVVPHGIDPEVYSPSAAPLRHPAFKSFIFLQSSFPWVLDKGFDLTIKAFSQAFSCSDDVSLVLRVPRIRDVEERNLNFGLLERQVSEATTRPGAPQIVLLELDIEPDQRSGLFTAADCYVFPLRTEGFSITILEAMACGLPVIATPWSGPADFLSPRWAHLLRHGRPALERRGKSPIPFYQVEPDLDHLIHLMRHVYTHRDEAKALGRRAAEAARAHWTWKHAALKLASLFSLTPDGATNSRAGESDETCTAQ